MSIARLSAVIVSHLWLVHEIREGPVWWCTLSDQHWKFCSKFTQTEINLDTKLGKVSPFGKAIFEGDLRRIFIQRKYDFLSVQWETSNFDDSYRRKWLKFKPDFASEAGADCQSILALCCVIYVRIPALEMQLPATSHAKTQTIGTVPTNCQSNCTVLHI